MFAVAQRLQIGSHHHQAGRLAEAEAAYREILRDAPQQPHALHLLGVVALQTGRPQEAVELIQRALQVHGPHAVFHSNLAAAYLALECWSETVTHCRQALRLQPNLADAFNNLGVALRCLEQLDEAEKAFREAIRLNPRLVDAHSNLGAVLHRQGNLPEALARLQELVRQVPGHAQAQNDLGAVLLARGQPELAEEHLREALRLQPHFASAHSNLGVALEALNRPDEALQQLREALRLNPRYATAHNNLGAALKAQGKMEPALAEFQETLKIEPHNAVAIYNLSTLARVGHYRFSEAEIQAIQAQLARPELLLDSRCRLHFALAQVFDKTQAYDEAFTHLLRANELRKEIFRRRGAVFNLEAQQQIVDRLIATFAPAFFEHVRSFGLDSELPIFIVGMPRSGTTLAEQILASHPQVFGAGELLDMERLAQTLPERLAKAGVRGQGSGVRGKEPSHAAFPECMASLDEASTRQLATAHLQRLQQLAPAALRVVDKMPFNFLYLGLIVALFPRARIIHCRREPLDTCLSCFFQNFAEHSPFTLDLRHLGQYYREYERLLAHWKRVLPTPMFELNYEELTADQEKVSRRLVDFCGLEWDERCLRFYDNHRVVKTFSALEVRQPMYRSSVGRWKRYEAHLQPLREALQE